MEPKKTFVIKRSNKEVRQEMFEKICELIIQLNPDNYMNEVYVLK